MRVALSTTQLDALAEQRIVVGRRVAGSGHQLVQPDSIDERRAGIDERHIDIGAHPQMVGRECPGVTAADDNDLVACVVFSHAPKTPRIAET